MSTKDRENGFANAATLSQRTRARRWPSWAIVVVVLVLGILVLGLLPVSDDQHAANVCAPSPISKGEMEKSADPLPRAPLGPARATIGDEDNIDDDGKTQ